ncbi:hypothetical protein [Flavobacterium sp.]|uniref:hypothetical protein n=1 Tax=Flavobacterium sp. TaxID=239 RepID=UPI003264DFC1
MKLQYLFILLILAGCQKEQKIAQTSGFDAIEAPKQVKANTKEVEESVLRTDTILFSEDKKAAITHILVHLTEQKADNDSIITSKFRLDFYQNKNKIASSKIIISGYQKGSEWSGSYGLNDASENSSFLKIDFGYPACGYVFDNYLYYVENNDLQLVHQWQSMSDSGWGNWTEFMTDNSKDPKIFYCKTVSFEPGDDDSEDSGILKYSDSVSFSLKGNQWGKKILSAKDKPYFEKKMRFDEFHNQQ